MRCILRLKTLIDVNEDNRELRWSPFSLCSALHRIPPIPSSRRIFKWLLLLQPLCDKLLFWQWWANLGSSTLLPWQRHAINKQEIVCNLYSWRYFIQNLNIIGWFPSSWQHKKSILLFLLKSPSKICILSLQTTNTICGSWSSLSQAIPHVIKSSRPMRTLYEKHVCEGPRDSNDVWGWDAWLVFLWSNIYYLLCDDNKIGAYASSLLCDDTNDCTFILEYVIIDM